MREKKTDQALLEDARFYNKHADYVLAMMQKRTFYERLGLAAEPGGTEAGTATVGQEQTQISDLTKAKLKKSFHR